VSLLNKRLAELYSPVQAIIVKKNKLIILDSGLTFANISLKFPTLALQLGQVLLFWSQYTRHLLLKLKQFLKVVRMENMATW